MEVYLSAVVLSSSKVVESVTSVVHWFLEQNQGNSPAVYHDRLCSKLALTHGESLAGLRFLFSGPEGVEQNFPRTYLTVLRNLDRFAWIKESERFAVTDHQIAKELLEYQSEQKSDSFYRNARVLFPIHPRELVDFLAKLIEPRDCLKIALRRTEYEMKNSKLNRHTYSRIASLLRLVGTHKELKPEVRLFARNLMVIHSRRSALRAELAKEGLI